MALTEQAPPRDRRRHSRAGRRRPRVSWAVATIVGLVVCGTWASRYVRAVSLVIRAGDLHGVARRLADINTVPYAERVVQVPIGLGPVSARIYTPLHLPRQTVLLVSGLHADGIDDPRLVILARELARTNVTVVTPEIPELTRFDITPALTDRIEQTAVWLAGDAELTPTGRIGMIGVSFSGGLSIVAAGRPSLRSHVSYVFALGGHDDLPRVLRYLCTGIPPGAPPGIPPTPYASEVRRLPHDYGVAIVLLNVADHLLPPEQVGPLRDAVRRFLRASSLDRLNRPEAAAEFAALRTLARQLPQPAAGFLDAVNDRDVARLGSVLLPHVASHAESAALSPSRSPRPRAPVFLLHGRDDTVIPAVESAYLAARLRGAAEVRLLLTDLIPHADSNRTPRVKDIIEVTSFLGDLLAR